MRNGRYVLNFLQTQPEWKSLKEKYEPRFHVRSYAFRDSWIVRATRLGVPDALQCRAVGHGLIAHARSYENATDATTREAFKEIQ